MKYVLSIIKKHICSDFSVGFYLSTLFYLAIIIGLQMVFDIDMWMNKSKNNVIDFIRHFCFYSAVYGGMWLLLYLFRRNTFKVEKPLVFWILVIFGLVILSMDSTTPFHLSITKWISTDYNYFYWTYSIIYNTTPILCTFVPLVLIAKVLIKPPFKWLGLKGSTTTILKPYFLMVLMIAPFVFLIAFEPQFHQYYPRFIRYIPKGLPELNWVFISIYELAYAIDFFTVETVFRGFFVIGLGRFIGKEAIIPMVTIYCVIHFGKPLGEIISSIFGGYLLGVLAFHTRSIWGGVIAHIGLAWLMELAGFVSRSIMNPLH